MSPTTPPYALIDAHTMNRAHPLDFPIPTPAAVAALRPGHIVKVGVTFAADQGLLDRSTPKGRLGWSAVVGDRAAEATAGERFWVIVSAVTPAGFRGTIDNDLAYSHRHGLKADDSIAFEARHVLDIAPVKAATRPPAPAPRGSQFDLGLEWVPLPVVEPGVLSVTVDPPLTPDSVRLAQALLALAAGGEEVFRLADLGPRVGFTPAQLTASLRELRRARISVRADNPKGAMSAEGSLVDAAAPDDTHVALHRPTVELLRRLLERGIDVFEPRTP